MSCFSFSRGNYPQDYVVINDIAHALPKRSVSDPAISMSDLRTMAQIDAAAIQDMHPDVNRGHLYEVPTISGAQNSAQMTNDANSKGPGSPQKTVTLVTGAHKPETKDSNECKNDDTKATNLNAKEVPNIELETAQQITETARKTSKDKVRASSPALKELNKKEATEKQLQRPPQCSEPRSKTRDDVTEIGSPVDVSQIGSPVDASQFGTNLDQSLISEITSLIHDLSTTKHGSNVDPSVISEIIEADKKKYKHLSSRFGSSVDPSIISEIIEAKKTGKGKNKAKASKTKESPKEDDLTIMMLSQSKEPPRGRRKSAYNKPSQKKDSSRPSKSSQQR